jgi:hypothetical protein
MSPVEVGLDSLKITANTGIPIPFFIVSNKEHYIRKNRFIAYVYPLIGVQRIIFLLPLHL